MVDTLGRAFLQPLLRDVPRRSLRAEAAGPGARLDADLPADGGGAGVPAARACSRRADGWMTAARPGSLVALLAAARALVPPLAALARRSRSTSTCCARIMIFAHRRDQPQPDPRLRRHGVASATPPTSASAPTRSASWPSTASTTAGCSWRVAIGASALVALAIGAISLRTSGIYFIMITLAFAQMLYYLGDLARRSTAATTACASTCAASSPG